MALADILPWIQVVISIALVAIILLQRSDEGGLGGSFGGGAGGGSAYTRRGLERTLFRATITLSLLFGVTAFIALLV
jgi:preprotein translocase subunit SecG